jgi:predicted nucleotidyltransferase
MTPLSDVDIALVIAHDDFIPSERLRWELAIEDKVVQTCKLKQADIRIINDAPLVLQGQVVTNGTLLFAANNEAKVAFETYVRSRYLDFLPVATLHRQAFFADIRHRGIDGQRSKS